ncbi:MAG: hypothetical protein QOF81_2792 [Acidimicrobiaceae bacterium]|nr:hypothetical protein [Acidimicrobiaceae bacterium]
MSNRHSFRARTRYRFDTTLASGTVGVIVWLAAITAAVVLLTGVIVSVAGITMHPNKQTSVLEALWENMLRSIDPSAMQSDEGWPLRLQSLFVVLFGILVTSSLIGLVATGIDRRVTELRKGRSQVLEEGHTLVLGWSEKIFPVISELVVAYRGQRRSCIVVLAPRDRVEMDSEIRARIPDLGRTRIVCRSGDPSSPADLARTSPYESRSVIVLASNYDDGDAQAIGTVLALMDDDRFANLRVVADCLYPENAEALREATDGAAITIASSDVIARVTAQACRHSGLGAVFQELLDFEDVEIQFDESRALEGRRFGDLVLSYETASAIGVRTAAGLVRLNPSDDFVFGPGDATIVVACDTDHLGLRRETERPPVAPPPISASIGQPARILMVGWNPLAPRIVSELDLWVPPGSLLRVLVDEALIPDGSVDVPGLRNLELLVTRTRTSAPMQVGALAAAERYERVVVLCYRTDVTPESADARTLMTLLQLRKFRRNHPDVGADMSIVCEVLDIRNVELARIAGAHDLIVSERLTALMLSQLAEIPEREKVFEDLFDVQGSEIGTRLVSDYTVASSALPYGSYVAAAQRCGHLAIGYQSVAAAGGRAEGIILNPAKAASVELQPNDRLIVVAPHRIVDADIAPPATSNPVNHPA